MIKFNGEISKDCKRETTKRVMKSYVLIGIFACAVAFLSFMPVWVSEKWVLFLIIGVAVLYMSACVLYPIFGIKDYIPEEIKIKDEYLVATTKGKEPQERSFIAIRQVIATEEWYFFDFCAGMKSDSFICQKDLLVEGTIEEFEELFAGKLVYL